MWWRPARAAGIWVSFVVASQASGETAKHVFDVPPGIAAIVVSLLAAAVTLITTFVHKKPKPADDDVTRLAIEALLVSLRRHEADADHDETVKEEQSELIRLMRAELEQKHRRGNGHR